MFLMSGTTEALSLNYSAAVVVALFVIYHLFMKAVFYKPLFRTLKERDTSTEGKLLAASKTEALCGRKLEELESSLRGARAEAGARIGAVRKETEKKMAARLEVLQADVQKDLESARGEIQAAASGARDQVAAEMGAFSRSAAERILGRELRA